MPATPDQIPEKIDFAAQELLEAPVDQRPAMLEDIAKALTGRLLQIIRGSEPERSPSESPRS
jgi:hypothetical protein